MWGLLTFILHCKVPYFNYENVIEHLYWGKYFCFENEYVVHMFSLICTDGNPHG